MGIATFVPTMRAAALAFACGISFAGACSGDEKEPINSNSTSTSTADSTSTSTGSGAAGGSSTASTSGNGGSGGEGPGGAGGVGGLGGGGSSGSGSGSSTTSGSGGAGGSGAGGAGGGFNGVFDVTVYVADTCDVITDPATLSVPAGTEFKVNWIHLGSSSSNVDIDKIDQFNQVPLIIDFEPGTTFFDSVHPWCGIFTGTFSFRVTGCFDPTYLDVNCDG